MAERKAVNKYYPPDWDPSKVFSFIFCFKFTKRFSFFFFFLKGSINTFRGQHPLRERARKLKTEGILVVRFEIPYNVFCSRCKNHIGKGVRFNAEKKKVGHYFSTPIFHFKMKCPSCPNLIEIQTDPKNRDYQILSGADRQTETWEPSQEDNVISLASEEEKKKLAEDPIYKLEHALEDKKKSSQLLPVLEKLKRWREPRKDDYELSSLARKYFREEKKLLKHEIEEAEKKGFISGPILPSTEAESQLAQSIDFKASSDLELQRIKRRLEIKSSSIFNNPSEEEKSKKNSSSLITTTTSSNKSIPISSSAPELKNETSITSNNTLQNPKKRSAHFLEVLARVKRAKRELETKK